MLQGILKKSSDIGEEENTKAETENLEAALRIRGRGCHAECIWDDGQQDLANFESQAWSLHVERSRSFEGNELVAKSQIGGLKGVSWVLLGGREQVSCQSRWTCGCRATVKNLGKFVLVIVTLPGWTNAVPTLAIALPLVLFLHLYNALARSQNTTALTFPRKGRTGLSGQQSSLIRQMYSPGL